MAESYELWVNLAANNIYRKFRRCLKGEIRASWDELINGEPRDEINFGEQLIDAHKNQVNYLRRTSKPNNLPVQKWFKRIRFINRLLPLMSGGAAAKSDEYMMENFVLENIPKDWRIQAELKGFSENTPWAEMLTFLQTCEKYLKKVQPKEERTTSNKGTHDTDSNTNNSNQKGSKNGSDKGNDGIIKNPCGLPGHSKHDYKDCKYNPYSKNYCGTTLTKKDFNEDGSKNNKASGEQTCTEVTKKVSFQIGPESDPDSDEEFQMAEENIEQEDALGAEILVSI